VNALEASDGRVVWMRDAAADTGAKVPGWGFSGPPPVVDGAVLVAAGGQLIAYDSATGSPRWKIATGGGGYSSPQLATLDGVRQVLLMSGSGAASVGPEDGKVLWTYAWEGAPILQPAVTEDGGVLINTSDMSGGSGTRRLAVAHGPEGWTAKEVWTSRGLKPYFNDIVVHKGRAYGFDGGILACIDLQDGKRKWKGARFGHGQLLLLRDQDLLLVVSEEGELGLVAADPGQYTEIARAPGIEGKTWNRAERGGDGGVPVGAGRELRGTAGCLRGVARLFDGFMEQHLDVGLVGESFAKSEVFGSFDVRFRQPHGDGSEGDFAPPEVAGGNGLLYQRGGGAFALTAFPPVSLLFEVAEFRNCDWFFGHRLFLLEVHALPALRHRVPRDNPDSLATHRVNDGKQAAGCRTAKTKHSLFIGMMLKF